MKIQEWLKNNNGNYELLENELGISSNIHEDGRVILNYSQIESDKFNPIVRECRGLVLDSKHNLVARAFPRFLNWGEDREGMKKFNFSGSIAEHKEDGSLILLYYWNGNWHVNTRNSYGSGCPSELFDYSWRDLVFAGLPRDFFDRAYEQYTYVFELCSPYNKVVRRYDSIQLFLLTCYAGEYELHYKITDGLAEELGLIRPIKIFFNDIMDAEAYIANQERKDKTFEGVVLRDVNGLRFKNKSSSYIALHRLSNNGNINSWKSLLPFVLAGEIDEVTCYFPEVQLAAEQLQAKLNVWIKEIDSLWFCYHDEHNRKKFANAVKHHPFSWCLFKARDTGENPVTIFRNNPERILKHLS